jgi:hypothetical protein
LVEKNKCYKSSHLKNWHTSAATCIQEVSGSIPAWYSSSFLMSLWANAKMILTETTLFFSLEDRRYCRYMHVNRNQKYIRMHLKADSVMAWENYFILIISFIFLRMLIDT